ncbi:methyltransferase type 12 [Pleurocapsales cyanobacterium LEGE 10410]|nr:methyltransferase type 12 [Pleurocapsales cyanobacterium LEGE 10410]
MKELIKTPVRNFRKLTGYDYGQWARTVMKQECFKLLAELEPAKLNALEISGQQWEKLGFRSYTQMHYPEFDICKERLPQTFNVIIADQVFEHLLWPYRAGKNVYDMLEPGGYFLITTPFLIRIHNVPVDCSRWTETGMKHLLAECGFPLDLIKTSSWGNRKCVEANLKTWPKRWTQYGWYKPLHNESKYPIVVWALAQK